MSESVTRPDKKNLAAAELRFGTWGPGYLSQEEHAAFGVVVLRPGDDFANHYHERHEESFLVLAGEAELWLDRESLVQLSEGDLVSCPPGVEHYLRNVGDADFRAFFTKVPGVPGDKIDVPWTPGPRAAGGPAQQ